MIRAVHGSTVLYPVRRQPDGQARRRDGRPRRHLVPAHDPRSDAGHLRRRTRPSRSAAARSCAPSDDDDVTIIGAGITLHEALKAADELAEEGINARVIDLYSVKPIDSGGRCRPPPRQRDGRIVTVEDHWAEGGIGEAVLSAFDDADDRPHVSIVAVREMPSSGKPMELLAAAGSMRSTSSRQCASSWRTLEDQPLLSSVRSPPASREN